MLITGGAGFIGSAIARRFLAAGDAVRILDNLETGQAANVPDGCELIVGDVRDAEATMRATTGCELVIHQAAMVSVPRSVAEPLLCQAINVEGTRHVLEAAAASGARRVVLASSAAVYGDGPEQPKHEGLTPAPASPYAYAKWLNELDAAYFSRYRGLETICTRYFNVFGPGQSPDSPYSGVISIAASKLIKGEPFTIFGTGEQTRDYVYLDDVVSAVVAAGTAPQLPGEVVNVGTGTRTSLLALLETMGRAIGKAPLLQFAPSRPGDVLHSVADVSRLRDGLGFRAETPLGVGLERTLAWIEGGDRQVR